MARRNPELDERIREAAREEFLEKGFHGASTRGIAARAGITTGALYTRYPDKDALFCSFLDEARGEVDLLFDMLPEVYENAAGNGDVEAFTRTLRAESESLIDLIYKHYDAFTLLFCHGEGSSAAGWYDTVVRARTDAGLLFLKFHFPDADRDAVALLIRQMMALYPMVVRQGFSQDRARACIRSLMRFNCAGWAALLSPEADAVM